MWKIAFKNFEGIWCGNSLKAVFHKFYLVHFCNLTHIKCRIGLKWVKVTHPLMPWQCFDIPLIEHHMTSFSNTVLTLRIRRNSRILKKKIEKPLTSAKHVWCWTDVFSFLKSSTTDFSNEGFSDFFGDKPFEFYHWFKFGTNILYLFQ